MPNPSSWNLYHRKAKAGKGESQPGFSRFQARYFLASELAEVKINGMSAATQHAYEVSLRVTLAYTALEALELALGHRKGIAIINTEVSESFRSPANEELLLLLIETTTANSREKIALRKFVNNQDSDLRPVAYAIRNLFAHGTLTANRLGLTESKKRRVLLDSLAAATLQASDERFTKYVHRMTSIKQ